MTEPVTSISAAAVTGAISAATLAFFGVDYYSMLYGGIGAMIALSHAEKMGRGRAVVYVAVSTILGAVAGSAVNVWLEATNRAVLAVLSVVCGMLAQAGAAAIVKGAPSIWQTAVDAAKARIKGLGGGQ